MDALLNRLLGLHFLESFREQILSEVRRVDIHHIAGIVAAKLLRLNHIVIGVLEPKFQSVLDLKAGARGGLLRERAADPPVSYQRRAISDAALIDAAGGANRERIVS